MTAVVEPRSPEVVMRLARMGSFHQCRLSFMRTLLRRAKHQAWAFSRPRFSIDDAGVGTALYTATTPHRTYSLIAFAHDLPDELRSDRVIATSWDATFTLFDGVPTDADIERLRSNVPLQEAGRISESELSLSRANRSTRLWSHVVDALAAGRQPDIDLIDSIGYLMRTTAVYGSGKFGAADRAVIQEREEFVAPFQVEMLTVYLIRTFVLDLVEHMASVRSASATTLDPAIRRRLGIGNSTGLGMAPFLLTHPRLIHNWIAAREEALARVRTVAIASASEIDCFRSYVQRARHGLHTWNSEHPIQVQKIADLRADLDRLDEHLAATSLTNDQPWDRLVTWASSALSLEGQELLISLVLEPYGDLVDDLTATMHADETAPAPIDGSLLVSEVRRRIEHHYDWALGIDWSGDAANARAWYVSEEKLEPRLGERHHEPIADFEQPLQPGRDAAQLLDTLHAWPATATLATVLRAHPEHRHTARRLLLLDRSPYGEIRDNTIDAAMLPIDLLRAKLSFFGATRFDPRSDRWVRITMFQGAPFPDELNSADPDGWTYPTLT